MNRLDVFPAVLWLVFGVGVSIASYRLHIGDLEAVGPGLFPFLLGIALSICALGVIGRWLLAVRAKTVAGDVAVWSRIRFRTPFTVVASLAAYGVLLERLGFLPTACLLLLVLFRSVGRRRWRTAVIAAVVSAVSAHLLFAVLLGVELPSGITRR